MRLATVLIVGGSTGLAVLGIVLAAAWHGSEVFSLPILTWRDVAAAAALAIVEVALVVTGVVMLRRRRRGAAGAT